MKPQKFALQRRREYNQITTPLYQYIADAFLAGADIESTSVTHGWYSSISFHAGSIS
jgi:hypothetical protein